MTPADVNSNLEAPGDINQSLAVYTVRMIIDS